MKKAILLPSILLALALAACSGGLTKTITFNRDQIQAKVEHKFPIEKMTLGMLKVILSNPDIVLTSGSDKIGLKTDVAVKLPDIGNIFGGGGDPLKGNVFIEGDVEYVPAEGTFYFAHGSVRDVNVDALPAEFKEPVLEIINAAAKDQLAKVPLMTLDETDLEEKAARYLLKSAKIKGGKLEVVLGIGGK